MQRKAEVGCSGSRERAADLVREALALLDKDADVAANHVKATLAALEGGGTGGSGTAASRGAMDGGAFGRAIGRMAAIVDWAARSGQPHRASAIAQAMEDESHEIAPRDLSTALLLSEWAVIVREQCGLLPPFGRRDN